MKIVTIIGARPQFIKAAAVSREIASHPEIQEIIVHTGQHFDANMSDIFFEEMQIPRPDYHLGINSMGHGAMTGRMLEKIEEVLFKEKPDYVMVYGDQFHAGRRFGSQEVAHQGCPCGSRAAELQYADAGRNQLYPDGPHQ